MKLKNKTRLMKLKKSCGTLIQKYAKSTTLSQKNHNASLQKKDF